MTVVNPGGGSGAVSSPINLVTVAASPVLANKLLAGDAQPAFQVNGDGTLQWGAGAASVLTARLRRTAGGVLTLDDPSGGNFVRFVLDGAGNGMNADGYNMIDGAGTVARFGLTHNASANLSTIANLPLLFATNSAEAYRITAGGIWQNSLAANEAATATAGAGGALPATVQGYFIMNDHLGTARKVPYYVT